MRTAVLLVVTLCLAACTPRPQARLVGVTGAHVVEDTTSVIVLVEIRNPTDQALMLSGFDYQVEAKDWFTARGSYALSRILLPGEVDYIEVPLPVKNFEAALGAPGAALNGVHFRLEGKLRAWKQGGEATWKIEQEGEIPPTVRVPAERRHKRHNIKVRVEVG